MAIENFTQADFEAALPKDKWTDAGIEPHSRQRLYTVKPFAHIPYAVLVFSSLQVEGASSKGTGKDSIRCVIVDGDGKPYGGKPVRWIDRRPGWQERLLDYLRHLANQILWLARPCPSCGKALKPFTAKQGKEENKGRGFVCCKNEGCASPLWEWTDDEEGKRIPPSAPSNAPAPVKSEAQPQAAPVEAPTCPVCNHHPMVRMGTGKGWRCGAPGNKWTGKDWTVCQGAIFDNAKSVPPAAPANGVPSGDKTLLPPVKVAGRLAEKIKAAIAFLDDDNPDEARRLLSDLL